MSEIHQFLRDHAISEVEAIIPDMAGIARGKIMPAEKYAEDEGMRLPESIFLQTVTGETPRDASAIHPSEIDIDLVGDPRSIRQLGRRPTAQVIMTASTTTAARCRCPALCAAPGADLYGEGLATRRLPSSSSTVEPNPDPDYPLKP